MSSGFKLTSISGLLCLSTVRDGVSLRHSAELRVNLIASRYDWSEESVLLLMILRSGPFA